MVKTPIDPPEHDPRPDAMAPNGLPRPRPIETGQPLESAPAVPAAPAELLDPRDTLARAQDPVTPESTFLPGEILAERFRILRFIAQGGAGEVYEAEDVELRVAVALKVVRPEIAENEHAIERFRREIQLARQVTHPNVCRIFDVFRHEIPDSRPGRPPRRFFFLTMELLQGESLAALLHRRGPLPLDETLPILRDMAAGLRAAHEAGVVHRDFKSANVVLVQRNSRMRAVITDFGLARGEASNEAFPATITQSGTVVGTPTYMAPEQLTGGEITAAVDVYALGIVLFETITGKRPFKGDTDLSTAVKRLTEAPPSPRLHVPDLDPRWEAAIMRCLERDPSRRYSDLGDLVAALENPTASPTSEPLAPPSGNWGARWPPSSPAAGIRPITVGDQSSFDESIGSVPTGWTGRPSRLRLAALIVLLLLAVASGFVLSRVTDPWRMPAPEVDVATQGRATVAVLEFKNLSGQRTDDWMASALQEMVSMELAAGGLLQPIPSDSVDQVAKELRASTSGGLASDTISKIRQRLGTSMVVDGSYLKSGSEIRLHLRLHTDAAPVLLTVPGRDDELFDLVSRAGAELRGRLGMGEYMGRVEAIGDRTAAGDLYQRGLAELHRFDADTARVLFGQAVELDPIYAEAYAGLASSLDLLGYRAAAQRTSRRAVDLSAPLSRESKLAIDANDALLRSDAARAVDLYGSLFRFFPDNLDYGLGHARALVASGRGDDALLVVEQLRQLAPSMPDAGQLGLVEAAALGALGDPSRQLDAARRTIASAESSDATLLAAEARLLEAQALLELGSPAAGARAARRAKGIFDKTEGKRGAMDALRLLTLAAREEGDDAAAEKLQREADALEHELTTEELLGWVAGEEPTSTTVHAARSRARPPSAIGAVL